MQIALSNAEAQALYDVVDVAFRNLKEEIYHTETPSYEEQLKARERLLRGLRVKLSESLSSAHTA